LVDWSLYNLYADPPVAFINDNEHEESAMTEPALRRRRRTMGLRDWLKRRLGPAGGSSVEMVRFYDFETRRVVQIPASELRAGTVQAKVQGIEGLVWILPDQLKPGDVKHPEFDESIREYIRQIQTAFAEQRPLSFEEWEDGFRRDGHPAREIAIWSHAADIYTAFAATEPSAERRRDIYRCIVACLTSGPDVVWHVLKPNVLSRAEAQQVVNRFFGKGDDPGGGRDQSSS
jgi:hypothetical protein